MGKTHAPSANPGRRGATGITTSISARLCCYARSNVTYETGNDFLGVLHFYITGTWHIKYVCCTHNECNIFIVLKDNVIILLCLCSFFYGNATAYPSDNINEGANKETSH